MNQNLQGSLMTPATKEIASLAAKLPPSDRLQLVETILATLDKPDPEIAAAWAAEAAERLAAYRRGELAAVDESEVFGDLDRQ
jgi:putative addiction module component (TIGR02574 family)